MAPRHYHIGGRGGDRVPLQSFVLARWHVEAGMMLQVVDVDNIHQKSEEITSTCSISAGRALI